MINSSNGYDKLEHVIVGRELNLNKRTIDFTFKHFYGTNLNQSVYEQQEYYITPELLEKRIYDLDNLASTLEKLNIEVSRPDEISKVIQVSTPDFKTELSSASNVRDLTIIIDNKIIETPTYVTNRYFENMSLYNIFDKAFDNGKGGQWIRCPHTKLNAETIDLTPWDIIKDYSQDLKKYIMAIDGAQLLRLNDDIIINVTSYNHYKAYCWIKSFFPEKSFHMISVVDNHIDGALISLNDSTFLINPKYRDVLMKQLPSKFKKYKFIEPDHYSARKIPKGINLDGQLSSSLGMDVNVLSIDPKTVLVNKEAIGTISSLEKNNFAVIPIELDNCEIFGGGIHCSTLDIKRSN